MPKNPVLTASAHLASAHAAKDQTKIDAALRELAEAKLRRAVGEALASVPPMTHEVRSNIARLLTEGGEA